MNFTPKSARRSRALVATGVVAPRRRRRQMVLWSATAVTVAGVSAFGVASSGVAASAASNASSAQIGPGYPPPGGIYAPFTNCALLNPLMKESVSATGCVAGDAVSGTIKIGNLLTQVVHPVTAQFGIWSVPNGSPDQFSGGLLTPPAGVSAELATSPEFVPGGLLQALGCNTPANSVLKKLCTEAANFGGKYLDVFALAQEALPISNFQLTTWTQPIKIRLVNPLLGPNCYIGGDDNPIVLNPTITTGNLSEIPDPNPRAHPNTAVLQISNATAADTIFSAGVLTGCGPGGSANIAVDEQLDSYAGLPSASGNNSLTLNGTFSIADCYNSVNQAKILLSAFAASDGTPPAAAARQSVSRITPASLRGHFGFN
jgi:hypothetical protein